MTEGLTRDICRDYFEKRHLLYTQDPAKLVAYPIRKADIARLRDICDEEVRRAVDEDPDGQPATCGLRMCRGFSFATNGNHSMGYAYLFCMVGYSRCKREAISFNGDGFIGFCGWADRHNSVPILKAFSEWMRIYLPTRSVAIVGAPAEGAEAGDGQ